MLLNSNAVSIETNLDRSQSTSFGIGDVSVIIEILRSKMYTNPVQTSVQEYICNGRDAMREAKTFSITPLEICVPNTFKPTFKVRDFGVGLSPERVRDVFVMYGSSTKRGDNGQTGGFGIGAKSAWAYTDSFTITSFYNGIRYEYVAHLGGNNSGVLDIISKTETTEPNGVSVEFAVKPNDVNTFKEAIFRCIRYWSPSSYKLLGTVDFIVPKILIETDDIIVLPYEKVNNINGFIIDNIVYPNIKQEGSWQEYHVSGLSGRFLLKFKTGEIDINPNRESIINNTKNHEVIKRKIKSVESFIQKERDEVLKHVNKSAKNILNEFKKRPWLIINGVDLGNNFILDSTKIRLPFKVIMKGLSRRGSKKTILVDYIDHDQTIYVQSLTDSDNQFTRKVAPFVNSVSNIVQLTSDKYSKCKDYLVGNVIMSDTLELPKIKKKVKGSSQFVDGIVYSVDRYGARTQYNISKIRTLSNAYELPDDITDQVERNRILQLGSFLDVELIQVPKIHKGKLPNLKPITELDTLLLQYKSNAIFDGYNVNILKLIREGYLTTKIPLNTSLSIKVPSLNLFKDKAVVKEINDSRETLNKFIESNPVFKTNAGLGTIKFYVKRGKTV